jgi:Domain of unknown function (DUF4304)
MPTISSIYIDKVVSAGVAPFLKGLGFRKRGRRFFFADGLSTAHIIIQASQWNSPNVASFTISLGRYFQSIARMNGETIVADPSKQRRMHVGNRIGHLLPQRADHWWSITGKGDAPQVAAQVAAALSDYGLPYLASVATLEGVAKLSGYIPGIGDFPTRSKASALEVLGRHAEAEEVRRQLSSHVAVTPRATE